VINCLVIKRHQTTDNNLFNNNQYGFFKGRSTMLQLLRIMDEWTECLESGGQINVIYEDFEKAFDKVSHKLLIRKLRYYKVNESVILWIESFLCNRKQRVKINGFYSDWADLIVEYHREWNYFRSYFVYYLYHPFFISGSKAHKNPASEKTETD